VNRRLVTTCLRVAFLRDFLSEAATAVFLRTNLFLSNFGCNQYSSPAPGHSRRQSVALVENDLFWLQKMELRPQL
jgi:hypothetical protein